MSVRVSDIQLAISEGKVFWKKHALEKMIERGISRARVKQAILECNIIENYPDDYPVPSFLIGTLIPEPLHLMMLILIHCTLLLCIHPILCILKVIM